MGCGCGKKKLGNRANIARSGLVGRQNPRPTLVPTNNVQARNSGRTPNANLNGTGISAQQKRTQQIRRDAILRNLGKQR